METPKIYVVYVFREDGQLVGSKTCRSRKDAEYVLRNNRVEMGWFPLPGDYMRMAEFAGTWATEPITREAAREPKPGRVV